jgi:hypothetical protein
MKYRTACALGVGLMLLSPSAQAAHQDGSDPAIYSNVELVSVDPARRIIVVKSPRGVTETFDMDDLLRSTGSVRAGDRVIITIRGGLGRRRISAISRSTATPAAVVVSAAPLATIATADDPPAAVKAAFARQVASLSQDARPIDGMWTSFVTSCRVKPVNANDGRAWFGLWDGRVQADYSSGPCRELFNQMVAAGEVIKGGMAAAEDVARKTLTPGNIRDIRKVSLMDWDGWTLPAPQKREP